MPRRPNIVYSRAVAIAGSLLLVAAINGPGTALADPRSPTATARAAQKQSASIRVGDQTVRILGMAWTREAAPGKFDFRDPTRDRSLRVVTLVVSQEHRGAFRIPDLGDKVEIAFLDGDPDRPVVLGLLFPKVDDVARGDDPGGTWVKIRLTFAAATRSKSSRSSKPVR